MRNPNLVIHFQYIALGEGVQPYEALLTRFSRVSNAPQYYAMSQSITSCGWKPEKAARGTDHERPEKGIRGLPAALVAGI